MEVNDKIRELTEKIRREGLEKAEAEASRIKEEAREEARIILDDAKAKAQAIYQQVEAEVGAEGETILQRVRKETERERSQVVATAQIEAQKLKLERREQAIRRVFAKVRERLTSAPQWPEYEEIARSLVRDAMEHLETDNAVVRADEQTKQVLTKEVLADLASKLGVYLRAGEPLERGTGVVVETPDGHRRYDNTLETRLARMEGSLRTTAYHILAGETE